MADRDVTPLCLESRRICSSYSVAPSERCGHQCIEVYCLVCRDEEGVLPLDLALDVAVQFALKTAFGVLKFNVLDKFGQSVYNMRASEACEP